ncbi:AMP-binding enzyme family protein [Mycobacterium xenopi 4042]|uniref:AMP-binding enzyme family protein n=1 Tax=Mycobacterium xenopi 4042 TaxID=1299334 RepID=X8DEX4_MYCXE|nr:AMP-binding enzyme family protein [Mycobacterium xenopi 4042]
MSIPVVFAEQVARSPEAVAVTAVGGSMTYRELDAAANRLAHLLTGLGVGAGQRVGVVARSVEAIVAIVAVLKTGRRMCRWIRRTAGAVEVLLEDAAPVAAVTTAGLAERLDGRELLVVDVNDPRLPPSRTPRCRCRRRRRSRM